MLCYPLIPLLSLCSAFHTSLALSPTHLQSPSNSSSTLPFSSLPCPNTCAQFFRASPHTELLLCFSVCLPFPCIYVACAGWLWLVKPNTSLYDNQIQFATFISEEQFATHFVNIFAKLQDLGIFFSKRHPHCFLKSVISVPPLEVRGNADVEGSFHIHLKSPVEENKIRIPLLEPSPRPGLRSPHQHHSLLSEKHVRDFTLTSNLKK